MATPNQDGPAIAGINTTPGATPGLNTPGYGDLYGASGPSGLFGAGRIGVAGAGSYVGGWFSAAPSGTAVVATGFGAGVGATCIESACVAVSGEANLAGVGLYGFSTTGVLGRSMAWPSGTPPSVRAWAGRFIGDVSVEGSLEAPIIQQQQAQIASLQSSIAALTSQLAALATATGTPGIIPHAVPGRIQAEDYDAGGENVGYFDTTPGNEQGISVYRNDDVDIKSSTEGGYAVGWMMTGEWLAYTVNVPSDGLYTINVRIGSALPGRTFHIEVGGQDATGPVGVPQMGDWDQYETVSVASLALHAGPQTFRIVVGPEDYMDFQWFEVRQ